MSFYKITTELTDSEQTTRILVEIDSVKVTMTAGDASIVDERLREAMMAPPGDEDGVMLDDGGCLSFQHTSRGVKVFFQRSPADAKGRQVYRFADVINFAAAIRNACEKTQEHLDSLDEADFI